jgi:mono/diheme cytochrome c family protein
MPYRRAALEPTAPDSQPTVSRAIPITAFVFIGVCIVLTFVPQQRGEAISGPTDPLAQRGHEVYRMVCQVCHNANPRLDGTGGSTPGPAIADASLELLQARVLRNEYPAGYKPKRDTRNMTAFPYLEPELPALAAFLEWSRR